MNSSSLIWGIIKLIRKNKKKSIAKNKKIRLYKYLKNKVIPDIEGILLKPPQTPKLPPPPPPQQTSVPVVPVKVPAVPVEVPVEVPQPEYEPITPVSDHNPPSQELNVMKEDFYYESKQALDNENILSLEILGNSSPLFETQNVIISTEEFQCIDNILENILEANMCQ